VSLAYFDTDSASNGRQRPHRTPPADRPKFRNRDNHRLRMLLIAGGLQIRRNHPQAEEPSIRHN